MHITISPAVLLPTEALRDIPRGFCHQVGSNTVTKRIADTEIILVGIYISPLNLSE